MYIEKVDFLKLHNNITYNIVNIPNIISVLNTWIIKNNIHVCLQIENKRIKMNNLFTFKTKKGRIKFEWAPQIGEREMGISFPRGMKSELTFVPLVKIKNSFLPHL